MAPYFAIAFGIFLLYIILKSPVVAFSRWQHTFDNFQFSADEFYLAVETGIKAREIPDVELSRVTHAETSIISSRREYVRVKREEYIFDICAAPFGKGFYVSWWLMEQIGFLKRLTKWMPTLEIFDTQTFREFDTQAMFKGLVHAAVLEAVDHMTNNKGYRALSELERIPVDQRVKG